MPIAGRASPAAHPQTEFTTTITVPFVLRITSSKSSGVRVSSTPKRVRSSLMGLIRISGYGITGVYHTGISCTACPQIVQNCATPAVRKPAANLGNRFAGTAPRKRGLNQFTGRVDHNFSSRDIFFSNFISNRDSRTEPTLQQNNLPLPGYGDYRPAQRYLLSLGETHIFSPTLTNELRAGANRVHIQFVPDVLGKLNPQDFGLTTGSPVFPNILVSGVLNFGSIPPKFMTPETRTFGKTGEPVVSPKSRGFNLPKTSGTNWICTRFARLATRW